MPERFSERQLFLQLMEKTDKLSGSIYVVNYPSDLDVKTLRWGTERLVNKMGPLVVTWPNVSAKVLHGALKDKSINTKFNEEIPPYIFSCPQVDEMLFGHEPDGVHPQAARYSDVSRSGPEVAAFRSLPYLRLTMKQMRESNDDATRKWKEEFGIGGIIPFATLRNVLQQYINHDVNVYTIPATSMAEAYKAILYRFAINDPQSGKDVDPWLIVNPKSDRFLKSQRLVDVFVNWIDDKLDSQKIIKLHSKIINHFDDLYFSSPEDIAELIMMMVNDNNYHFKKDSTFLDSLLGYIAEDYFDPSSVASHFTQGSQDDASEVVIQWDDSLEKNQPPPVTPWNLFVLVGDGQTSMEQLMKQAQLCSDLYKGVPVFIIKGPDGQPVNIFDESQIPVLRYVVASLVRYQFKSIVKKEIERYYQFAFERRKDHQDPGKDQRRLMDAF
ncbi:hypothetical protein M1328_03890 [Patescibacteria group bacterium]|nr:hypothetical protein [Patescibacteria group bacterium]